MRINEGEHPDRKLGCDQFQWKDGPACVLIYTTSQCIFCPAAKEVLEGMMKEHGLPVDTIREVDCDTEEIEEIKALPTIQICGQTIIGLPSSDTLNQMLWKLRVNPCFYMNQPTEGY